MDCKTLRALWLTDVDDTLIPISRTRDPELLGALGEFLRSLEERCVLVVPVTFKTQDELEYLAEQLGYKFQASIVEGGCLVRLSEEVWSGGRRIIELCRGLEALEDALVEVEGVCRGGVVRVSRLSPREAAEVLRLPPEEAARAAARRYTEILYSRDAACLEQAAKVIVRRGLKTVRSSRRLLHVTEATKGEAASLFLSLVRHRLLGPVVASGDSEADGGFLELADMAIVVSKPYSTWFRGHRYLSVVIDRGPWGLLDLVSRLLLLRSWSPEARGRGGFRGS